MSERGLRWLPAVMRAVLLVEVAAALGQEVWEQVLGLGEVAVLLQGLELYRQLALPPC